jgi:hypothetical protein
MMAALLSGTVSPKGADFPVAVPHIAEAAVIPVAAISASVPALISKSLEGRTLELPNPHHFVEERSNNYIPLFTLMPQHIDWTNQTCIQNNYQLRRSMEGTRCQYC